MYREAKLYYGDGSCYVEGQDITGVQITYKGSISVQDKTNDEYVLSANNSTILIVPISKINNTLSNLFEYNGTIEVVSVILADRKGKKISTIIKKIADYAEMLSAAESITLNSEDLSRSNKKGHTYKNTLLNQTIIPNLNTMNDSLKYYTKDGSEYNGHFHIHIENSNPMTGKTHTDKSEDLYIMLKNGSLKSTKIKKGNN